MQRTEDRRRRTEGRRRQAAGLSSIRNPTSAIRNRIGRRPHFELHTSNLTLPRHVNANDAWEIVEAEEDRNYFIEEA
jgi:hypothetical protein